jgi:hypothetical protein
MPLDQPTPSGPPAAYFPAVGDSIVVGIVDVGDYHQRDYTSGELKFWPDGGKVMGKVVTGLVVSFDGTTGSGSEKANGPVAVGDLVTFWCEGGKFFTYRDALNDAGSIEIGDVMFWRREADEPSSNPRYNDRKVYTAKIRRPEARDGDLVERCTAKHRELKAHRLDQAEQPEPFPATAGAVSIDPGF